MDRPSTNYTKSYVKVEEYFGNDGLSTIGDCLRYYAGKLGDKEAVVFASTDGVGERQIASWREIYEKSCAVARALIARGIKQGECIAVNIRPCPEFLFFTFGSILAGARTALVTFVYKDGSDLLSTTEQLKTCAGLALDPGFEDVNWNIVQKLTDTFNEDGRVASTAMPYMRFMFGARFPNGTLRIKSIEDLIVEKNNDIELPSLHEDEIALMMQSSGSTGFRKLVAHTHTSCLFPRKLTASSLWDNRYNHFNDRPFYWISGFPYSLFIGQKRVTVSGFGAPPPDSIQRIIDIIAEERCTLMVVLPPTLMDMIHAQDKLPADWPLQVIVTGAQPLMKNLTEGIGKLCTTLMSAYGSTEFIFTCERHVTTPDMFIEYSVGQPFAGSGIEMKVVNDAGLIVPVNSRGELIVRSPGLFKEYYNDPKKTSKALTEDGWYKTDDLGRIDENGDVYVEGRKSNMIVSGGNNISPETLERVIKTCPGIEQVVIVPVPDDVHYQLLCACVIVRSGSCVTEEDLRKHCEEYHNQKPGLFAVLPKFYLFLDEFPVTATGKTYRKALEILAKDRFSNC